LHGCDEDHSGEEERGSAGDGECGRWGVREMEKYSLFPLPSSFFLLPSEAFYLQKTLNVYNQQVKYLRQDLWKHHIKICYNK